VFVLLPYCCFFFLFAIVINYKKSQKVKVEKEVTNN